MHYQALYQQSKWKRQNKQLLQQSQSNLIRQLSSSKKINQHSHIILANRLSDQLSPYNDFTLINIETSIPILHRTAILQVIEDIESAKQKLERGEFENSRLREQARFVYCLWKMIDQEEIQTRELKEIVYMLNDKSLPELRKALAEIYTDVESVGEFVETWRTLMQDGQYYRAVEKIERKTMKESREAKERCSEGLRDAEFARQYRELHQNFMREPNRKDYDFATMESVSYSTKNKQNISLSGIGAREKTIVNRLYQNNRYQQRDAMKKVQDERKVKQQLEQCTFKPQLCGDHLRSISRNRRSQSIRGFDKTVNRLKVGVEKSRIARERREHKPAGENYYKLREKNIKPPSFLERKKEEEPALFVIEFDLGRHKVKVKVRQNDVEEDIAKNLCKIYCLKQDYFEQICMIIRKEREAFQAEQDL